MNLIKFFFLLNLLVFIPNMSAQSVSDSIQKLIIKEKNEVKKVDLLFQLAESFKRSSTDSVILYAKKSLEKANEIYYDLGTANANFSLAYVHYIRGNSEKAELYCKEAIKYRLKSKSPDINIGNCYRLLAGIYLEQMKFEGALKYFLKAKDLYSSPDIDNEYKTLVLNDIAFLYLQLDNYIIAMNYLNEAIATAKENDNTSTLADCYIILAQITNKQDDHTKAIEYYNLAKDIYSNKNDLMGTSTCNLNLGIAHYRNKSYSKAISFLEEALEQFKNIKLNTGIMDSQIFLSKSHTKLNNIDIANSFLTEANNTALKLNLSSSEIIIAKSDLLCKQGDFFKAIALIENHLKEKKIKLLPKKRIDLYETLTEVYQNTNNFEKAFNYKKEHFRIKDSLNDIHKTIQVKVLQAEFDYKKVKNDLKENKLKLNISEEKTKASNIANTLLVISGAFLIIISVLLYKRKKEKLDAEIAYKNKQITDFALHISEKNELLLKIKNKIKTLTTAKKDDSKKTAIITFLNNNLEENNEKVALYVVADNTKDDFYHKISKLYPELSEKEKRVATLVRLDLSSKQIGIKLNITKASVNNYRYSLRKKMNIPKEVFLYDFIKKV